MEKPKAKPASNASQSDAGGEIPVEEPAKTEVVAEVKTEEPKVEEAKTEEVKPEEVKAEEPKVEEPKAEKAVEAKPE